MLITLYKIGGVLFRLLAPNSFRVKAKKVRFTAASSRCRQNLKYENFTSSFGRLRQNIAPKSVQHVQHDCFYLFNQSNHWFSALSLTLPSSNLKRPIRELKQPRRRRQQKPHKFAYLTMKNRIFARFARAFLIFWHFKYALVLSTTWNDLFCSWVDDGSIWLQMFNFVLLCPKRWFQFNSRIVRTHFSSIMSMNNWKMIAETRSHIFRWRSRLRRRRVCLSSLLSSCGRRHKYANDL